MTTYFYDLKKAQGKLKDDGIENPVEEQEHRKNQKHIQQQKRIEVGSLDPQNITQAKQRKETWEEKDKKLLFENSYQDNFLDIIQSFKDEEMPLEFKFSDNQFKKIDSVFDELNRISMITETETLAFLDVDDIQVKGGYSKPYKLRQTIPTQEQIDILDASLSESLIAVHNHPSISPPSIRDLVTYNQIDSLKYAIIETVDNYQYYIYAPIDKRLKFDSAEDVDKFVKQWNNKIKKYSEEHDVDIFTARHEINKQLCAERGWSYGRRKR